MLNLIDPYLRWLRERDVELVRTQTLAPRSERVVIAEQRRMLYLARKHYLAYLGG